MKRCFFPRILIKPVSEAHKDFIGLKLILHGAISITLSGNEIHFRAPHLMSCRVEDINTVPTGSHFCSASVKKSQSEASPVNIPRCFCFMKANMGKGGLELPGWNLHPQIHSEICSSVVPSSIRNWDSFGPSSCFI